ncbi:MAG: hypothetical protein WCJ25_04750 [Candidatus Moraniibacteriota bacterium]
MRMNTAVFAVAGVVMFLLAVPSARAACDIAPLANGYLNDASRYVNLGYAKPTLIVSDTPLVRIGGEKAKEYGKVLHSKGFRASQLDYDTNEITVYSHVFDGHASCDDFVTGKLKRLVVHEYTHVLDADGRVSAVAHTKNMETTAIIGENVLPKMIWGVRNTSVLRQLTRDEKKHTARVRRFLSKDRERGDNLFAK